VLGVSKETVAKDLGKRKNGNLLPPSKIKNNGFEELEKENGNLLPPPVFQSPNKVVQLADKEIKKKLLKQKGGTNVPSQKIKDNDFEDLKIEGGTNVPLPFFQSPKFTDKDLRARIKEEKEKAYQILTLKFAEGQKKTRGQWFKDFLTERF